QAERALKNISDDHADVKAANALVAEQGAALAAAAEVSAAFEKKQNAVRSIASYPNFKADCEKLKTLTKVYAPFNFLQDPKRVAEINARWNEDVKAAQALFQTYRPIVEQQTFEGKDFQADYANLAANVKTFLAH